LLVSSPGAKHIDFISFSRSLRSGRRTDSDRELFAFLEEFTDAAAAGGPHFTPA
jgi:hypothetical protein